MVDIHFVKASDYCESVVDGTHDSPKPCDEGFYLITSKHLLDYEINFASAYKISEADYNLITKRSNVKQWDILFSMIGTVGRVYIERNSNSEYACKNVGIFKCGGDKHKALWLYYVLKSPYCKQYISKVLAGSTQSYISLGNLRAFPVPVIADEKRNRIIEALSTFDKKIELNNKINDNLLQQARALYQAWFVDYVPFNGVRPSDWIDDTINGLAKEVICGKTPSTKAPEYYGNDIPFITIPDMHGNTYAVTTERYLSSYGAQSQHKKNLPRNSICVSCIGTAGLVTLTAQESQTNQQINSIIPKEGYSPYYIYLLMETLSVIINNLGQSGSTIVNLNKAQFGKIAVVIPSIETMKSFDEIVSPMFESILSNQKENIKLAELRDSLLPRLMSGKLDISEIYI